ncbi:MAG: hypothetical protein WAN36_00425, partial [Calditrichia bacterium]
AFHTLSWEFQKGNEETGYSVRRAGEYLIIRGIVEGDSIIEEKHIGATPWVQNVGLYLSGQLKEGKRSFKFITLRPMKSKFYTMQANYKGNDQVEVNGQLSEVHRVVVSLTGFLSRFGGMQMWFREKDWVFLASQSPASIPLVPDVRYELVEER